MRYRACQALREFKSKLYGCLAARADALFELADAILCAGHAVTPLVQLSLAAEFTRGHGALYDALAAGRIDEEALAALLTQTLPPLIDGEQARAWIGEHGNPGAPALLLIHGSAGSLASWDAVVPSLAPAFRAIRVDLLGCGRSATPAGGYDIPTQARRVCTALDKLGLNRMTVIAHSGGCTVATALAEQRPGAVAALALIDMGPTPGLRQSR